MVCMSTGVGRNQRTKLKYYSSTMVSLVRHIDSQATKQILLSSPANLIIEFKLQISLSSKFFRFHPGSNLLVYEI